MFTDLLKKYFQHGAAATAMFTALCFALSAIYNFAFFYFLEIDLTQISLTLSDYILSFSALVSSILVIVLSAIITFTASASMSIFETKNNTAHKKTNLKKNVTILALILLLISIFFGIGSYLCAKSNGLQLFAHLLAYISLYTIITIVFVITVYFNTKNTESLKDSNYIIQKLYSCFLLFAAPILFLCIFYKAKIDINDIFSFKNGIIEYKGDVDFVIRYLENGLLVANEKKRYIKFIMHNGKEIFYAYPVALNFDNITNNYFIINTIPKNKVHILNEFYNFREAQLKTRQNNDQK